MRPSRLWAPLLGLMALLSNALVLGPSVRVIVTPGSDFLSFYAGAKLAGSDKLYDPAAAAEIQKSVGWSSNTLAFIRLPFYAHLLKPFALLEYNKAFLLWQGLNLAGFLAAVALAPIPTRIRIPAALGSYPAVLALMNSQDVLLVLLIVTLVWRLLAARPVLGGFIQSAAAIKFHLFLLVPIYAIVRREWRFFCAAASGLLVLVALSFTLQGNWVPSYLAALDNPQVQKAAFLMPNLRGLLHGAPGWAEILAASAAALVCALAASHRSRGIALGAALLGGVLASRHAFPQDLVLVYPLICAGLYEGRTKWLRGCCLVAACPFLYVMFFFPVTSVIPQLFFVGFLAAAAWDARAPYAGTGVRTASATASAMALVVAVPPMS